MIRVIGWLGHVSHRTNVYWSLLKFYFERHLFCFIKSVADYIFQEVFRNLLFYIIFCSVTLSLPHQGLASVSPSPWICSAPVTALNNELWREPSYAISGTTLNWSGGCYFQLCSSQSSCKKCLFPEITMLWLGESLWRDPGGWDVVRRPVKEPHEDPL